MLETIARVPYFSYLSVLHLYETLGYWRKADLLKVHFAQTWNELHHLLIMQSLGGSQHWIDRFIAQHVAVAYYCLIVPIYMFLPSYAYYLMELIEGHAYHTYDEYLQTDESIVASATVTDIDPGQGWESCRVVRFDLKSDRLGDG